MFEMQRDISVALNGLKELTMINTLFMPGLGLKEWLPSLASLSGGLNDLDSSALFEGLDLNSTDSEASLGYQA